jgi:hypothetical protein
MPTVIAKGGKELELNQYCSTFMASATAKYPGVASEYRSAILQSKVPKVTVTISMPGTDRQNKDDWRQCLAGAYQAGWGGRPSPWLVLYTSHPVVR